MPTPAEYMKNLRDLNGDYASRNRAKIAARQGAFRRLAERHEEEFEELYLEELQLRNDAKVTCPVCLVPVNTTTKGLIRSHKLRTGSPVCPGSGKVA